MNGHARRTEVGMLSDGVDILAGYVASRVRRYNGRKKTVVVVVMKHGAVHVANGESNVANIIIASGTMAGTYTRGALADDIADDLRACASEMGLAA